MSDMIICDPDEVDAFARELNQFANQTREGLRRISSMLRDMGNSSWRDQNYQRFEDMFQEIERLLQRSVESIESEQVPHLHALAERARQVRLG